MTTQATFTVTESSAEDLSDSDSEREHLLRRLGVGMIGAGSTKSPELEKYLKTKVEKMGHLLTPPLSQATSLTDLKHSTVKTSKKKRNPLAVDRRPVKALAMEESIASLIHTDPESVDCEDGCDCSYQGDELSSESRPTTPEHSPPLEEELKL